MSVNSVPSIRSEAEELRAVNSILLETFSKCDLLKFDILEYSTNPKKDLQDFKEKLVDLAEMQKDVTALINTMEEFDFEIQDKRGDVGKLNLDGIATTFSDAFMSALEGQCTSEDMENMISAVDAYISNPILDANMGNEDLLVTATKETYLDPLTKCLIQDPVKSKICHHAYERGPILKHLQKYTRCPYSGCVSNLSREDLVEDLVLKRKLLNMKQNSKK